MLELVALLQPIAERGLLFGLIVIAVYITSRVIKFDDLTVEGSFGIGGALSCATLSYGLHPLIGIFFSMCAGGLAGLATGLLHTKLKINNLISGIVVTTGLFSITLKIAGANATIMGKQTVFDLIPASFTSLHTLIILTCIVSIVVYSIQKLLASEVGFLIKTVGDNPQMLTNLGKNINAYMVVALVVSNMLTALSGALFVHYVGYFSIWANVGILISALTGLILAELISTSVGINLIIGSMAYQCILALTFELQIAQEWNKLLTAIIIVVLLAITSYTSTTQSRK